MDHIILGTMPYSRRVWLSARVPAKDISTGYIRQEPKGLIVAKGIPTDLSSGEVIFSEHDYDRATAKIEGSPLMRILRGFAGTPSLFG